MNSWKITESNVKKNGHLLLRFLLSPPVFRVVSQYRGRWKPTMSCGVLARSTEQGLFPRDGAESKSFMGKGRRTHAVSWPAGNVWQRWEGSLIKLSSCQITQLHTAKSFWLYFVHSGCLWSCQSGGFETHLLRPACSTVQLFLLLLQSLPTWVSV